MPDNLLTIHCSGSIFNTPLHSIKRWRTVLDCADALSLSVNGAERVHVQLGGLRRWIAFERSVGGSPFAVVGYQETVGATWCGNAYTGGSNRKVLAWVAADGAVSIGAGPGIAPSRQRNSVVWLCDNGRVLTDDQVPEVLA